MVKFALLKQPLSYVAASSLYSTASHVFCQRPNFCFLLIMFVTKQCPHWRSFYSTPSDDETILLSASFSHFFFVHAYTIFNAMMHSNCISRSSWLIILSPVSDLFADHT